MSGFGLGLVGILAASVMGSLHCVAMCGGFAAAVSGSSEQRYASLAAYHGARALVYLTLGGLAGFLGAAVRNLGALAGLQAYAGPAMGLALLVVAAATLHQYLRRSAEVAAPSLVEAHDLSPRRRRFALARRLRRSLGPAIARRGILGSATAGFMSGLLPCAWLWSHILAAAATQSIAGGLLVMAAFFIGTVPALFAVGFLTRWMSERMAKLTPVLAAAALAGVGLLALFGKVGPPAMMEDDGVCRLP